MKSYRWTTPAYEKMRETLLQDVTAQLKKYFLIKTIKEAGDSVYVSDCVQMYVKGKKYVFSLEELNEVRNSR
jgi:hypothetical protein